MTLSFEKYRAGKYSFRRLRPKLKLAFVNQRSLIEGESFFQEICPNLFVAVVVDTRSRVVVYRRHPEDRRQTLEIFDDALVNTFHEKVRYVGDRRNLQPWGCQVIDFHGGDDFLTSLLLNPLFRDQFSGELGFLFSFVSRTRFLLMPVEDRVNLPEKAEALGLYAIQQYATDPGNKVVPDLFFFYDDRYHNISTLDDELEFSLRLPRELGFPET